MKNLLVFFLLLAYNLTLPAQVSGNRNYNQESSGNVNYQSFNKITPETANNRISYEDGILLDIHAIMNVKAQSYVAIFSITQTGKTAIETQELMEARIKNIQERLQSNPAIKEVYVDMISFVPMYEFDVEKKIFSKKTYNEIPIGFTLQKNLHVSYTAPKALDDMLLVMAKEEVYDLVKVDYFVENYTAYYDTLRTAIHKQLEKELAIAAKQGLQIDKSKMSKSEVKQVFYPIERYQSYTAYHAAAANKTRKSNIVNQAAKKKTQFYQGIAYKGFDIVLHPEVVEPVLQFTYNLKIKYPKEEVAEPVLPTKIYHIITPDGTIKKLDLK